jgi:hypothetical protein
MTLLVQESGMDVTAAEVIPEAVEIMGRRGVRRVIGGRLEDMEPSRSFDTLLLLMNGSTLAGSLSGVVPFFRTLEGLLSPGGQVLLESTDLRQGGTLPEPGQDPEASGSPGAMAYPGEVQYQMEFRGEKGAPFPQLFLDPELLEQLVAPLGWRVEVVWANQGGEYLARLTRP